MQVLHSCLDGQTALASLESRLSRSASFARRLFTYFKTNPPLTFKDEIAYKHNAEWKDVFHMAAWIRPN